MAKGRLAPVKKPRSVEFVDALPITITGKVLRSSRLPHRLIFSSSTLSFANGFRPIKYRDGSWPSARTRSPRRHRRRLTVAP
jgi:hypothetical protein